MKHYFVRYHVTFPPTLDLAGWEAEQGLTITYEHPIEYESDLTEIAQLIADRLFHERGNGDPTYYFRNTPVPTVRLIDWRELLGGNRPSDAQHVDE